MKTLFAILSAVLTCAFASPTGSFIPLTPEFTSTTFVQFSPTDSTVLFQTYDYTSMADLKGREIFHLKSGTYADASGDLGFKSCKSTLAIPEIDTNGNEQVNLYDYSGNFLRTIGGSASKNINLKTVQFSSDCKMVFIATVEFQRADKLDSEVRGRVFDVETGALLQERSTWEYDGSQVVASPDFQFFAVRDQFGFEAYDWQDEYSIYSTTQSRFMLFSEVSPYLISVDDESISMHDLRSRKIVSDVHMPLAQYEKLLDWGLIDPTNKQKLLVYSYHHIFSYDLIDQSIRTIKEFEDSFGIYGMCVSKSGDRMLVLSEHAGFLIDSATGNVLKSLNFSERLTSSVICSLNSDSAKALISSVFGLRLYDL